MSIRFALVALAVALVAGSAGAADAVKRVSGSAVNGNITKMSATDVTIEKPGGAAETIPVSDIEEIVFDKEPGTLRAVRNNAADGNFDAALATLEKVKTDTISRPELLDDIQFYRVLCEARLALAGSGDLQKAGGAAFNYVSAHPSSFHFLQANELLGDLFAATGKYTEARQYYGVLEKSTFPEYKARGLIAQGRVYVRDGKFDEALKAFDGVLAMGNQKGALNDSQRYSATLGKALCLAETGKVDDGIKQIEEVIKLANVEDAQLMGEAYVTLGKALLKKGNKKEALLAFLHVDVLFFSNASAHAESLKALVALWNELGKPERATLAAQTLQSRYSGGR
ncbi:MAG: tetratricopeptide repeat protein [Planctomycetes bacterium]|nr:tetratricopeptide repeat protein [Planctomycetota bacterium]